MHNVPFLTTFTFSWGLVAVIIVSWWVTGVIACFVLDWMDMLYKSRRYNSANSWTVGYLLTDLAVGLVGPALWGIAIVVGVSLLIQWLCYKKHGCMSVKGIPLITFKPKIDYKKP